ncbi:MAG TPA: hypothetical protein GXZ64_07140 [Clostridiaceae bacterium]|nr:hypothetical protein [Clostridiaceae bacterium]
MILSLLLALAAVVVLHVMGVVPLYVLGATALVVVVCLAVLIGGRLRHVSYLTKRAKEVRAKWAGALTLVFGIPTVIERKMYLFISRKDELLIENEEYTLSLPLSTIGTILIISAGALRQMSDRDLADRLHFTEKPRLNLTRAWVRRHPEAINQKLVLFWVQPETTALHKLGDILVFADDHVLGDLTALLRRPEVAVKTTVIEEKTSRPAAGVGARQITEEHTQPFLVSRVEKLLKKDKKGNEYDSQS